MEHSKLHTGIGTKVNQANVFDSQDRFVAEIGPCGHGLDFDVAHAKEFVTCWNEHDKFKAKAGLLDEVAPILDAIEKAYRSHEIRGETVNGNKLLSLAHGIMAKHKELNNEA